MTAKPTCGCRQRHAIWTSSRVVLRHYVNMDVCDITPRPSWTREVVVIFFSPWSGRYHIPMHRRQWSCC